MRIATEADRLKRRLADIEREWARKAADAIVPEAAAEPRTSVQVGFSRSEEKFLLDQAKKLGLGSSVSRIVRTAIREWLAGINTVKDEAEKEVPQ